jgi:sec-independent protein translocase protein TatB
MIDIAFSKLAIIAAAALVFIGPEKLPKVARMAGTLFGRAQRYINDVKAEVSREMELDELRKMHQDIREAAGSMERSIAQNLAETENDLHAALRNGDAQANPLLNPPSFEQPSIKSKNFRKKKLAHTSALPSWYKRHANHRSRVISGAARMARYGTVGKSKSTFFH